MWWRLCPHVTEAVTVRNRGCNLTVRNGGCHRMEWRLKPHVLYIHLQTYTYTCRPLTLRAHALQGRRAQPQARARRGLPARPLGAAARSKCDGPPWQCAGSPPVPPQRAPGGSGQPGSPRVRPSHWAPRHRLGGSSEPPPKSPISLAPRIQVVRHHWFTGPLVPARSAGPAPGGGN